MKPVNSTVHPEFVPTKKQLAFLSHFIDGGPETFLKAMHSATAAGISRSTYYAWYNHEPGFKEYIDTVLEQKLELLEAKGMSLALEGDTSMIRFFLERLHRRYRPKAELDITSGGEPITRIQIIEATPPNKTLPPSQEP